MKKISTLFKKDPSDLGRVIEEYNTENIWVTNSNVKATRKFDGTACAIINGKLYKRYDVKKGKTVPVGAIPCQDSDEITGHWPHWVKCDRNDNSNKYHFEAFDGVPGKIDDGTFELCGPKIQGNPENFSYHILVRHGYEELPKMVNYDNIKEYLTTKDIEGIVYHHPDGRMCKIRKSDFGIKR